MLHIFKHCFAFWYGKDHALPSHTQAAARLTSLTDNMDDPPTSFFDLAEEDRQQVSTIPT
jgi:hypothetical protein